MLYIILRKLYTNHERVWMDDEKSVNPWEESCVTNLLFWGNE